ncbi:hypothetical protein VIGAN_01184300 [Vigna angularis var. angularis]|uniref:Uncharacterized protein n=1 Tax=Vigna angularis var. angularis TaxID=157739 RepID=A0A0S3R0V1_PHAAN|nr:hypothetical protein VIGAN_01184300 [Vigna angularis var. angularis]
MNDDGAFMVGSVVLCWSWWFWSPFFVLLPSKGKGLFAAVNEVQHSRFCLWSLPPMVAYCEAYRQCPRPNLG